jgi:D-amino-acid dehydrogenase
MGFRPSTPDSLPILGELEKWPGIFLAFGHGHFGMTSGPPSGKLLAQLITRRPPHIDPLAYNPKRFS